jgi:hypothetical protein
MSRQGGLRTRPYQDPTIRHSRFAIFNPFAIRRLPPLATRHSLLAVFHHSPFAIRYSRFLTDPCSPTEMGVQQRTRGCPQTEAG